MVLVFNEKHQNGWKVKVNDHLFEDDLHLCKNFRKISMHTHHPMATTLAFS